MNFKNKHFINYNYFKYIKCLSIKSGQIIHSIGCINQSKLIQYIVQDIVIKRRKNRTPIAKFITF